MCFHCVLCFLAALHPHAAVHCMQVVQSRHSGAKFVGTSGAGCVQFCTPVVQAAAVGAAGKIQGMRVSSMPVPAQPHIAWAWHLEITVAGVTQKHGLAGGMAGGGGRLAILVVLDPVP